MNAISSSSSGMLAIVEMMNMMQVVEQLPK